MIVSLGSNHEGVERNSTLAEFTSLEGLRGYENLIYVVVHPDHRSMGIGKRSMEKLLEWVEARCKAVGSAGVAVLAAQEEL